MDVRWAAERVNPDLFPIIGSVTHEEVYLEELRTALRQTYMVRINENGRLVDGVTSRSASDGLSQSVGLAWIAPVSHGHRCARAANSQVAELAKDFPEVSELDLIR